MSEQAEQPEVEAPKPLAAQWSLPGLIAYYNTILSPRGIKYPVHLIPVGKALLDLRIQKLLVIIGPGSGKALDPDTLVLGQTGWIKIGNLKAGDYVVTPDGDTLARVRGVFWQPPSQLYRITFADGRQILANRDHLWKVYWKKFAKRGESMKWRLRTSEEIAAYLWHDRNPKWYVPLTEPVDAPHIDLPIHPYILGCILGDGDIGENGCCGITSADQELVERLKQFGQPDGVIVSKRSGRLQYGVRSLGASIRALGLAGKKAWDKFIPEIYMRASLHQRIDLLQGLMDTDGYVGPCGTSTYCSVSERLARDVQSLIWSLGGIAKISPKKSRYTYRGKKLNGRMALNVNIRHPRPEELFSLSRKKLRSRRGQYSDDLKLEIIRIELTEDRRASVCINIDHPDGLFLAENYVVTHNSQLLSQIWPTYVLGHDPTQTILGISAGEALMQGFVRSAMEIIEWSPFYHRIFPATRPDKSAGWSTERGMFVTGRSPGDADASYWAAGLDSKSLTGKHGRMVQIDDGHDKENSASVAQCEKVIGTYYTTVIGRADPRGARFVVAGRRWNGEDLYGHLKATGEWVVLELPAERAGSNQLYFDVTVPDGLECVFTEEARAARN